MDFRIAVMPGDGIGPEVVAQGVAVLQAVGTASGHAFDLSYHDVGGISIDRHGTALRDEDLDAAAGADAILFGSVGGPKWDDPQAPTRPEDGLLALRKRLGLFANLRPVKVFPSLVDASVLKPSVLEGVDMLVVRELTGGIYYGKPRGRKLTKRGWSAVDTMRYSEAEIERVLRVGFESARERRKHLCSVDKANVLETSRLWRRIATDMAAEYPDVTLEHMLVDTCAMQLGAASNTVRRDRSREHIRRHPYRRSSGTVGVHGPAPLGQLGGCARCRGYHHGDVRAHPRLSPRYRWQGHRQPHCNGSQRRPDAPLLPRSAGRGSDDRGSSGDGAPGGPSHSRPSNRERHSPRHGRHGHSYP